MIRPSDLDNRMVNPDALTDRQAMQQPRPFDFNEPSTLADVPEPGDDEDTPPPRDPTEHAEIPHARDEVVEGDDDGAL